MDFLRRRRRRIQNSSTASRRHGGALSSGELIHCRLAQAASALLRHLTNAALSPARNAADVKSLPDFEIVASHAGRARTHAHKEQLQR